MAPRYHYLDALRAFCLFYGIFFHVSEVYSPKVFWLVNSAEPSTWVVLVGASSQAFRMAAFFLISGFFSTWLLSRRSAGEWLATRLMRILLPMVTVGVLFNSVTVWLQQLCTPGACDVSAAAIAEMAPLQARALVLHLWFLEVLLIFVLLTALARQLALTPLVQAFLRRFADVALGGHETMLRPLIVTFLGMVLAQAVLSKGSSGTLQQVLIYLPHFALGAALALSPRLLERYRRLSLSAVSFGLGFLLLAMAAYWLETAAGLRKAAQALSGLCFTRLLIALAFRYLDRPHPFIRRAADLSFSVYLLHLPVIVILAVALFAVDLTPVIEFLLISGLTLLISWSGAVWINRSEVARLLFNGIWHEGWSRPAASGEAVRGTAGAVQQ